MGSNPISNSDWVDDNKMSFLNSTKSQFPHLCKKTFDPYLKGCADVQSQIHFQEGGNCGCLQGLFQMLMACHYKLNYLIHTILHLIESGLL
jgi:hypothetical protein